MKINLGVIIQQNKNKTVIFDGEKSILYTLNESASFIFNNLKKGKSTKEIVSSMVKKFEIREDLAKKDFDDLIRDLKKKKIIF